MDEMRFYITKTRDGFYHVQNVVGTFFGQHHVHTEKGFKKWSRNISKKNLIKQGNGSCDCCLSAGEVKSHDGHVTFNSNFI
jgi:hypothetical protein